MIRKLSKREQQVRARFLSFLGRDCRRAGRELRRTFGPASMDLVDAFSAALVMSQAGRKRNG